MQRQHVGSVTWSAIARGVGKTVLLNRFAEIAADENLLVGFIEAPESGDFHTLLAGRSRNILLSFDEDTAARR